MSSPRKANSFLLPELSRTDHGGPSVYPSYSASCRPRSGLGLSRLGVWVGNSFRWLTVSGAKDSVDAI